MEKAYRYTAKTSNGQRLEGVIYAESKPLAFAKLKRGGFLPLSVSLSPGDTVKGWMKPDFDKRELSRLYTTVGRRLNNGKSLVDGLEAASEYIQDNRLRQAVMLMRQAIVDGQSEFTAMLTAGFPRRDALVIRSTAETGKTGETFISLGEEIAQAEKLRKGIVSIFRMPMIMAGFMALFIWAALMFIAPATLSFLKQTGLKLNFSPLISAYFKLVELFHVSWILSTAIYFGGIAAIVYFIRSDTFKRMLDKFSTLKNLSTKSDHAALWQSFSLLYDAAIPTREAAAIVGDSAKREDSKEAFRKMAKLVESGHSVEAAVAAAGFPKFVVAGISSAASSGDLVSGIQDMVRNLQEDVQMLTELLQENAKIGSVLLMGVGLLIVFVFTYYPMIASVMSNV